VPSTQAEQEAVVNRLTNRLVAASAGLAACGLILTGCGAGQISQTADQQSAVNGSTANVGQIALRNIHLQAVQTGDTLKPGRTIELIFVAANISPDANDKLVSISSDVGTVSLTGDTAIPAGSSLIVGTADGQSEATAMGSAEAAKAEVTLTQPISNGLTYKFTFSFSKAGQGTVEVPISAGGAPRQDGDPVGASHG
jgi:copper(I)-binding protein